MASVVLNGYAVLYRKMTEACIPYPIAHVALPEGVELDTIIEKAPAASKYPRYKQYWLKLGAPVRHIATIVDGETTQIKAAPIIYLRPKAKKQKEPRKRKGHGGETRRLASYFVNYMLGRVWTKADTRGMHMAHAKRILDAGYTADRAIQCLDDLKSGKLTDGIPWVEYTTDVAKFKKPGWVTLLCVLWGEPPAIERVPTDTLRSDVPPEQWLEERKKRENLPEIIEPDESYNAARDLKQTPTWAGKDK